MVIWYTDFLELPISHRGLRPPAPLLGGYRDVEPGWAEHHVVVKDGRDYDGFGPADGAPIDEYKELWEFLSDINFGF